MANPTEFSLSNAIFEENNSQIQSIPETSYVCIRDIRSQVVAQTQEEIAWPAQAFLRERQTASNILFDLGSFTKASYNAARLIRSRRMNNDEFYSLIKLSRNIENPASSKIQDLLYSGVKFRTTMHWSKAARPLEVLPLAHPHINRD